MFRPVSLGMGVDPCERTCMRMSAEREHEFSKNSTSSKTGQIISTVSIVREVAGSRCVVEFPTSSVGLHVLIRGVNAVLDMRQVVRAHRKTFICYAIDRWTHRWTGKACAPLDSS